MALGYRRTRDISMGGFAIMWRLSASLLLCGLGLISGCTTSSIGSAVGAVSGVASSAATANPVVGYAVGVSMQAATDATIKYVFREWTNEQQNLMAHLAGELPIGETQSWQITRVIPLGNEQGQLQVVREISNPLVVCREILFTVEDKEQTMPYLAAICKRGEEWKWASTEPSVQRWSGLH